MNKRRGFSKPAFLSDLAPITVSEGDTLQAKVIISGEPTPYAKWYINNQLVYQTEDTQITNENGVYSLVIHGCTTDMTGTIKCVAGNKMGEASTEGKLTVIRAIPVEFETSLCDAVCREGDTLKLKAVLVGEPMPDVSWFVNGKKLVESQNIKIHADKGTYTVTIKDITCDYSGKVSSFRFKLSPTYLVFYRWYARQSTNSERRPQKRTCKYCRVVNPQTSSSG